MRLGRHVANRLESEVYVQYLIPSGQGRASGRGRCKLCKVILEVEVELKLNVGNAELV